MPALEAVPVFLPWGMKDWVLDEFFLQAWVERFPRASVRRFRDCGHFLLEDAAAELVPLLRGFLTDKPVPA